MTQRVLPTSTCTTPRATEAYRLPGLGRVPTCGGRTGRPDLVAAGGRGAGSSFAEESSEAEASLQPSVSSPPLRSAAELASPTVDAAAVLRSAAELASSSSDAAVESSEEEESVMSSSSRPFHGRGSLLLTSYLLLVLAMDNR